MCIRDSFQPPAVKEALARAGIESRHQEGYYSYLVNCSRLVKINEELYFHREAYDEAVDLMRDVYKRQGVTASRDSELQDPRSGDPGSAGIFIAFFKPVGALQ